MSAPEIYKPTHTRAPFSSSLPSPQRKCPSSLQTPHLCPFALDLINLSQDRCLFSLFLSIGLFPSAYTSNLRKTFPSLHTLWQLVPLFQILSFKGKYLYTVLFYALFTLQPLQYHFCPYRVSGLTKGSMLWNPVTFSPSLSHSIGSSYPFPPN